MDFTGTIISTEVENDKSRIEISELQRVDGVVFNSASELGTLVFTGKFDFKKNDLLVAKPCSFKIEEQSEKGAELKKAKFRPNEKCTEYTFKASNGDTFELDVPTSFLLEFHMNKFYNFTLA